MRIILQSKIENLVLSMHCAADAALNKSELNQLWTNFSRIAYTAVNIGRQRITYDNQRFIANLGWRQLEQTYNSSTLTYA